MLLRPFIQILTNCCKTIFKALEIIYWKAIAVFNLLSTRTLDNTLTVWHDITQTEDQTHLIRHFKLLLLCNNHSKPLTVCHLRMNCSDANLDAVQLCCSWTGFTGVMKGHAFSWESHSYRRWILTHNLSHDPCTDLNESCINLHNQHLNIVRETVIILRVTQNCIINKSFYILQLLFKLIDLIKCVFTLMNNVRKVIRIENNYFKLLQTCVNFAYKLLYVL